MSGQQLCQRLGFSGVKALKYKEFKVRDDEWPPRFTKLELVFSKGTCLAFSDPRRLGRIKLRASPSLEPPISDLGPDPVVGPFPLQPFHEALKKIQVWFVPELQSRAVGRISINGGGSPGLL